MPRDKEKPHKAHKGELLNNILFSFFFTSVTYLKQPRMTQCSMKHSQSTSIGICDLCIAYKLMLFASFVWGSRAVQETVLLQV